MGSCCSFADRIEPQEGTKFEQFGNSDHDGNNKNSKPRSCTDVCFLIFMILFMVTLCGLLMYCMVNGNIFRVLNGYDSCGNICGKQNGFLKSSIPKSSTCKEQDLRDKRYLLLRNAGDRMVDENNVKRECVGSCNITGYRPFLNRCVPDKGDKVVNTFFSKTGLTNFFQEASEDIDLCWRELVYLCLIALAFSIIIMLLFRFFVGIVVWVVLIGVSLACIIASVSLWVLYVESKNKTNSLNEDKVSIIDSRNSTTFLIFAIVATIVTAIVLLVIIGLRKRIQLTVQLFKEAGRSIGSMPMLLFEPLLTFLSLIIVVFLFLWFCLYIQSSGTLTEKTPTELRYHKNIIMKLTRWYNLLAMLWMAQFVIGCQHMVISGAVSTWYFTRDKSKLGTPILSSFDNLVRYHLGSVALGSFIISLIQFLRILLKTLQSYLKNRTGKCVDYTLTCCQCCMACFEKILQYLSRNAYIEVAMHGLSFCAGGKQAFKLLVSNAIRVAVINSVGDFVLFLGKVLVVISTVFIGIEMLQYKEGLQHIWVPIGLAGLFAYFISHCFMTVYEMSIDTIFLCFCEDSEENDGVSRQYYMSKGLMEYVENSKKALVYLDKSKDKGQAWQEGPATISDKVEQ